MPSSYDDIAPLYDVFWSDWYLPCAMPALEKLFFSCVDPGGRVLDVCCGSGHVTGELVRRGYRVTGVDNSAALIKIARRKLPGVDFCQQDVRRLSVNGTFDAALSTFDSINHIPDLQGIRQAFASVHACLTSGGRFVFDMNLAEAYFLDLAQWQVSLSENSLGLVRGRYDPTARKAETELMWFEKQGDSELWLRRKSVVDEYCYEEEDITAALREAGFNGIEAVSALQAGMHADMAIGRIFFVATR